MARNCLVWGGLMAAGVSSAQRLEVQKGLRSAILSDFARMA